MSIEMNSTMVADGLKIDSVFAQDSASVLYADKSNITVSNSVFRDANCTMIHTSFLSSLTITNSSFKNCRSPDMGGFLRIEYASFLLENVDFENGAAFEGGALHYVHHFKDSIKNHQSDIKN